METRIRAFPEERLRDGLWQGAEKWIFVRLYYELFMEQLQVMTGVSVQRICFSAARWSGGERRDLTRRPQVLTPGGAEAEVFLCGVSVFLPQSKDRD